MLGIFQSIDNRQMKHVKIARKTELKVKTILRAVFTWFFGQSMIHKSPLQEN